LQQDGADIVYHDPYVPSFDEHGLRMENMPLTDELLESCSMVIIATDHQCIDYDQVVARAPHVLDTRNATRKLTGNRDKVTLL
jgi:UDP-N-acetyl-D-glucosamine dehydrogenase